MPFIRATDYSVGGEEKDNFWVYKRFFKRGAEVWHLGAVCESGQCPQLWDLSEMSWKRSRLKPQVCLWLWKEGFSKTSPRAFHELSGLERWPLATVISTDVRTGVEFNGIVQSLPKSMVNLLTTGDFASSPEIRCHVGRHRQIYEAKQMDIAVRIWNNSSGFKLQIFLGIQLAGFSQTQSANRGKET